MGACEAGDRGKQRAVVLIRFGHLIVEALVVLSLGPVVAEQDPFGDHYSRAAVAVVVGKLRARHGDRELGVT